MADRSLEELLPRAGGSIYTLVRMASLRALELADGKKPLIEKDPSLKLSTVALYEIADGKVATKEEYLVGAEEESTTEDEK